MNKQKLNPLKQGLANYGWWTKSSPQPVFICKVLLEHAHTHHITSHLFIYCLQLLSQRQSQVVVTEMQS